jgi:hypothetical protein
MESMTERIDYRIEMARRLQWECFEALKPWLDLLVDIENHHFPKLYFIEGEFHREDNYSPEDAELRGKILQVIGEIKDDYENRLKPRMLG